MKTGDLSFKQLTDNKEYKNINCYDDQIYKRVGKNLFTKSKFSGGYWNSSSATRTGKVFVEIEKKLTERA